MTGTQVNLTGNLTVRGDMLGSNTTIFVVGSPLVVGADLSLAGSDSALRVSNTNVNISGNLVGSGVIDLDNADLAIGGCLDGKQAILNLTLSPEELNTLNSTGNFSKQVVGFQCLLSRFSSVEAAQVDALPSSCGISNVPDYKETFLTVTFTFKKCASNTSSSSYTVRCSLFIPASLPLILASVCRVVTTGCR